MTTSHRPSGHTTQNPVHPRRDRRPRRPHRPQGHLAELGVEVTASRLRILGHPARLRIMRALEHRSATAIELAEQLALTEATVSAHLRLLCRAGILLRADRNGPPGYRLLDWPSLWLVDQLARRLAEQTQSLTDDHVAEEGFGCR